MGGAMPKKLVVSELIANPFFVAFAQKSDCHMVERTPIVRPILICAVSAARYKNADAPRRRLNRLPCHLNPISARRVAFSERFSSIQTRYVS